jgi:hypothetical protein
MTETAAAVTPARARPLETLAGFLAAAAIAVALLGILYKPTRLALPAAVIALACVMIGGRYHRLATWAVWIAATSWFLGMAFAVITKHSIW